MGDSKGSYTNFELNESQKESVQTPQLSGGDLLNCKSSVDIVRGNVSNVAETCGFTSDDQLMKQLMDSGKPQRCEAPTHETRGPVEVTKDENGEVFEVKTANWTFTKGEDGKWIQRDNSGLLSENVVTNFQIDDKGNYSYNHDNDERNSHYHVEHNADGSMVFTDENGRLAYDEKQQVVEAGAGDGRQRKFHYDENGQLDQIDGNLGHWDRQVKDGHISWVNKDSGVVWNGDFKMVLDRLQYRGDDGGAWEFTPWGTDVRIEKEP